MTTAPPTDGLLTVAEVAARLRVNQVTVRRMVARGELAAHQIGRHYRVPLEALEAYLDAVRTSPAVVDLR